MIERVIPFDIKRIFYIYGVDDSIRGGHRHKKTIQAAICLKGSCKIYNHNDRDAHEFILDSADQCLLLDPEDWHQMYEFSEDAMLMVLASELFDADDYIYEPYRSAALSTL